MSPKHRDTQDQPPRLGTHRKRAGYTLGSRHNPGGGAGGEEQELLFSLTPRMNTGQALDGCRERFRHVDRHCLLVPASRARMEGTVRRLGTGDGSRALEIGGVGKRHRMRWCKGGRIPTASTSYVNGDTTIHLRVLRDSPNIMATSTVRVRFWLPWILARLAYKHPPTGTTAVLTRELAKFYQRRMAGRCRGQIGNHRAPGT